MSDERVQRSRNRLSDLHAIHENVGAFSVVEADKPFNTAALVRRIWIVPDGILMFLALDSEVEVPAAKVNSCEELTKGHGRLTTPRPCKGIASSSCSSPPLPSP